MRRWLTVAVLLAWGVSAAPSGLAAPPEPGMLLVARNELPNVRFRETVVLVLQSDVLGAVGLIVNRPSRLPLAEALPLLAAAPGQEGALCYGGPVAPRAFIALVKTSETPPAPAQKIFASVYLTGPDPLSDWLAKGQPEPQYRVFAGYAGWAPGQLEGEVGRGDWQVLTADEKILFAGDAERLWRELATKGAGVTSPPPVGGD